MPVKFEITPEIAKQEHDFQWAYLKQKYGNVHHGGSMPEEERWRTSKVDHGLAVLQGWNGAGSADILLRSYGIPEDVRIYLIEKYCSEEEIGAEQKPVKRAHKYAEFEDWAQEHAGEQFTTEQLIEQSGFSHATTLKYLNSSLYFTKVKKGLWEARSLPSKDS